MKKREALQTTLGLFLTNSELRMLLDIVRAECDRRKALTTESYWHDAIYSLRDKIEQEANSEMHCIPDNQL